MSEAQPGSAWLLIDAFLSHTCLKVHYSPPCFGQSCSSIEGVGEDVRLVILGDEY